MRSTIDLIIEGLQIVKQVEPGSIISAEHEVIIAGLRTDLYSPEQCERLTTLGWMPSTTKSGGWKHYV